MFNKNIIKLILITIIFSLLESTTCVFAMKKKKNQNAVASKKRKKNNYFQDDEYEQLKREQEELEEAKRISALEETQKKENEENEEKELEIAIKRSLLENLKSFSEEIKPEYRAQEDSESIKKESPRSNNTQVLSEREKQLLEEEVCLEDPQIKPLNNNDNDNVSELISEEDDEELKNALTESLLETSKISAIDKSITEQDQITKEKLITKITEEISLLEGLLEIFLEKPSDQQHTKFILNLLNNSIVERYILAEKISNKTDATVNYIITRISENSLESDNSSLDSIFTKLKKTSKISEIINILNPVKCISEIENLADNMLDTENQHIIYKILYNMHKEINKIISLINYIKNNIDNILEDIHESENTKKSSKKSSSKKKNKANGKNLDAKSLLIDILTYEKEKYDQQEKALSTALETSSLHEQQQRPKKKDKKGNKNIAKSTKSEEQETGEKEKPYEIEINDEPSRNTVLTKEQATNPDHFVQNQKTGCFDHPGWIVPESQAARQAMEIVKSHPEAGQILPTRMNDGRFNMHNGWIKMMQIIQTIGQIQLPEPVEIHYILQTKSEKKHNGKPVYKATHFKFKEFSPNNMRRIFAGRFAKLKENSAGRLKIA